MKKTFFVICLLLTVATLTLATAPAAAKDGTWEGSIQGLTCATQGKVCPVNMEDPLIAVENTFVLMTGPKKWYLLTNLNRGILARNLNKQVRVIGEKSPEYNSIIVKELYVNKNGKWRLTWSPGLEKQLQENLFYWGGTSKK